MNLFLVAEKDEGIKLERWLKASFPALPRSLVEKGLRKGWIKINNKRATLAQILSAGNSIGLSDHLTQINKEQKKSEIEFSKDELRWIEKSILYQDKEILVINKPHGLSVQGGSGQTKSVDAMISAWAGEGKEPRLVHRLDRDTSGVLVLAKTAAAAKKLSELFANHEIEKTYLALIVGVPKQRSGVINVPLAKRLSGKNSAVEKMGYDEGGKEAVTEYKIVEHYANKLAWVELKPITGRTHQLRVHMANARHPIVGDGKYGGTNAFVKGLEIEPKLHLHALSISIPREDEKPLFIKAPLSAHMERTKKLLA